MISTNVNNLKKSKNLKNNLPKSAKFNLTEDILKIDNENVINFLEQWPGFSSCRVTDEDTIVVKHGRIKLIDAVTSKMPNNTPKPKLLTFFEDYIQEECKKHGISKDSDSPVLLQIYREVFEWIIEAFKTYQPLLSRIKQEYETTISKLKEKIRTLEPLKETLWTIAEEKDQLILKAKLDQKDSLNKLMKRKQQLKTFITDLEAKIETKDVQIEKLQKELESAHASFKKENDSRKLLVMDINEQKGQIEDMIRVKKERESQLNQVDPLITKMALEEAKKAQAAAVKEVSDTRAIYFNVVPIAKFEKLNFTYQNLLTDSNKQKKQISEMDHEVEIHAEKFNALVHQRDFYYLKYMDLLKQAPQVVTKTGNKNLTTRSTDTDKMLDIVNKGMDQYHDLAGKSPTVIAEQIMKDLNRTNSDQFLSISNEFESTDNRIDSKAALRTVIEIICDLPPGSINPTFDPMVILPILSKEKLQRDKSSPHKSPNKLH